MTTITSRLRLSRVPRLRFSGGISAIIVKELRGRMRGRRAFIIITIHVLLLALIGWMLMRILEEQNSRFSLGGGGFGVQVNYASAAIGRGIFIGLMLVQTLMITVLAPAATAGAISSEREHQTLELLAVTPISSIAIVLGKLVSALAWLFVLILASIPVTALVFVFGGVAPDDMIRAYIVLFATVIGLGSVGIFFSTLTRRTGASTGLTFVVTLALVVGSVFLWIFLSSTRESDSTGLRRQPPEALLYLNPFVAQMDVACGTEDSGFGDSCGLVTGIVGQQIVPDFPRGQPFEPDVDPGFGVGVDGGVGIALPVGNLTVEEIAKIRAAGGVIGNGDEVTDAQVTITWRDRFWPKTVLAFLFLATVMTLASVQFVTPTRRWRPSLPGPVRRLIRRRSA
jgi:ABC-type transport system involved in multi-copper enzyme maturation permease subunit